MGGSFDAFKWAKDSRVGEHPAKLVLILMADKVNSQFELYPSKTELANDCEMSKRTLDKWLTYLDDRGFVTLVERLRSNGSQARTLMLVNHPDAPHMNGEPICLDYRSSQLYPKDPDRLRARGFQWIAGGQRGGELGKERTAKTAKGQVRGGAESAPPGGAGPASLNSPTDSFPTNSGWGWGASSTKTQSQSQSQSPGARFLTELAFPDGTGFGRQAVTALADHVDLLLISGWTEDRIRSAITDATGAGKIKSWPAFSRSKLEALRPLPATQAASAGPGVPPWCGECGDPRDPQRDRKCRNNVRQRVLPDGRLCSCALPTSTP